MKYHYAEGWHAARLGILVTSCPHPTDSAAAVCWRYGWGRWHRRTP